MPKAWAFEYGPEVVGPVAAMLVGMAGDLGDFVQVWLAVRVVMVAMPHDVVGVGTFAFARVAQQ